MSWRYCSLALSHRYSIRFQDFRLCHPQTTSLSPFSFVNTALILLCFLVIFITLIVSLMCLGSIYVNCAAHSCRFGRSVARGTPYVGISYVWHCYLDGPEKRQGCKYAYSSLSYIFLKGNFRTNSFSCEMCLLTHWGRDKMAAISQMAFSNAFSWKKKYKFRLRFHWSLFLRVQLTIFQHWFRLWLGAYQATSFYLSQWWLDYQRIYASPGLNDLMCLFG